MSENSINSISSVRPADSGPVAQPDSGANSRQQAKFTLQQPQVDVVIQAKAQVEATAVSRQAAQADQKKTAQPAATNQSFPLNNSSAVSIHFRVDEKTKDVTVFVVDRKSKKVLRTIPASELSKLSAGDLLKLTA